MRAAHHPAARGLVRRREVSDANRLEGASDRSNQNPTKEVERTCAVDGWTDGWMGPAKRVGTEAGGGGRRCDVTHDSDGHQRADWDEGVAGRAIAAGPRALRPGRWNGPPPPDERARRRRTVRLLRGIPTWDPGMNAPSHIPRRRQASVAMSFVVGRRNYEIDVDVWRRSRSGACAAARASGSVRRVCGGAARAAPRCGHRGRSATCWLPTNRAEQHCRRTQRFALPTHARTHTHIHTHTHSSWRT